MSKSYRDLDVFKLALDLVALVYALSERFPSSELYGLTAQMRRASVSVISQIAEGHGRLTFRERRQFCSQARGSLFEIEAQTMVAVRLAYITTKHEVEVTRQIKRTGCALDALIRYVRSRETARKATQRPSDPATQ